MGFFGRIFGEALSEEEQRKEAKALIRETRYMTSESPKKALKILRKRTRPLYGAIGIGGPVHKPFKEAVQSIWSRNSGRPPLKLPTVTALPWSTWQHPTLQDLQVKSGKISSDILYCKAPEKNSCKDAIAELEALQCFADDAKVMMAIIYEEDMLFRKSFVLEAAKVLDPGLEEIGQGFIDYARQTGRKTINL